jgi:hypothetical protein
MELIADILLVAGAFGAAIYCMVLSRRLQRLTRLESGMGGAIAVLSAQVDDLTRMLGRAETAAKGSSDRLEAQTRRAETAVKRLEILLATLNDLPEAPAAPRRSAEPEAAVPSGDATVGPTEPPVPAADPAPAADSPPAAPAPQPPAPARTRVVQRRRSRRAVEEAA